MMNPLTASQSSLFAVKNQGPEKSQADIESIERKKDFFGSRLVNPVKNAARYVVSGVCTLFRSIRSFLITICSPLCSCFRKKECASSWQVSQGAADPTRLLNRVAADPTRLLNRVKVVCDPQGITGLIKNQGCECPPYGVVNSIDMSGRLLRGAGCAIKELAGDDYARKTREMQKLKNPSERLGYGQCVTYDRHSGHLNKSSGLDSKCRGIHNVLVPPVNDPKFETLTKNCLLTVFSEAIRCGATRIIFPMLGCVRLDATGERLAQVFFAAAREFESSHPSWPLPEIILVGTDSVVDKQACMTFESKWAELNQQAVT